MNDHEWEADHGLPMKWPNNEYLSQPYIPYIHDLGEVFNEEFGITLEWNPQVNSVGASFPLPFDEDSSKSSLLPIATTAGNSANISTERINYSCSEGPEDEDNGDLMSDDYKDSPEALSPATKNDYKPTWQTKIQTQGSAVSTSRPDTSKRRRLSKSFDDDNSSLNTTSGASRRRSQRKPPPFLKASQSYTEGSTGSSSPEVTQSNEFDSHVASLHSKRCHNLTEKKYRNRLNGNFDTLLSAIPSKPGAIHGEGVPPDASGRKVSKGEVLLLAFEHIKALEKQNETLQDEKRAMAHDLERLKGA